jgi:uncharacterized protein
MNGIDKQHIDSLRHQRARARRAIAAAAWQIADQDRDRFIEAQKMILRGLDIELNRLGYRPPPVIYLDAPPPRQPAREPVLKHLDVGLTIRSLDSDQRRLEGLATTPETDLLGDRVNPRGAKYSLPVPLLLFHDHSSPVGEVVAARPTDDGIEITAQIARLSNDGEVKRMCDRAWDLVRSKLIKGLSIGFKAIEREVLPDGGYYFKSWQWLELSLVTVAAQPQAKITATRVA